MQVSQGGLHVQSCKGKMVGGRHADIYLLVLIAPCFPPAKKQCSALADLQAKWITAGGPSGPTVRAEPRCWIPADSGPNSLACLLQYAATGTYASRGELCVCSAVSSIVVYRAASSSSAVSGPVSSPCSSGEQSRAPGPAALTDPQQDLLGSGKRQGGRRLQGSLATKLSPAE